MARLGDEAPPLFLRVTIPKVRLCCSVGECNRFLMKIKHRLLKQLSQLRRQALAARTLALFRPAALCAHPIAARWLIF
jgi:hypothetical protein